MDWTGSCFCGATEYLAEGEPNWAGHCHCKNCQRWTGSNAFTGVSFALDKLKWTKGEPRSFQSSPGILRQNCPKCGSPMAFLREGVRVTVTAGTLDNSERIKPTFHIYSECEPVWAHFDDGLPRGIGNDIPGD